MISFRNLLVGLDLGERGEAVGAGSRKALRQARSVAEKVGASITLLHSSYDGEAHAPRTIHPDGAAALEALRDECAAAGASTELVLSEEEPWLALIRLVLRGRTDLVFVGKRTESSEDGRQLGTVATKLVRKCPAPVWAVHPEHAMIHERVMVATDLTPVSERATRLAAWVAETYGAELHAVHVFAMPMELQLRSATLSGEEYDRELRAIEDRARQRIEEHVAASGYAPALHLHMGCTTPSRGVLAAIERLAPDLLVMGSVSRGGVAGLLVGNTAEKLFHRVECSLLTIKPADFRSVIEDR